MSEREIRSSAKGSKKRKCGKKQCSYGDMPSTPRGYVPNFPEYASLWDKDKDKALKVAVELQKVSNCQVDESNRAKVNAMTMEELEEGMVLEQARVGACLSMLGKKCRKLSEEAAESRVKIIELIQELKEVQCEADLGKINLKIAEELVKQAKCEKDLVELKSQREKACLQRKIVELETELQQLKDRLKDAPLDAQADM